VLALNKFGSKERLAQDIEIELTGFGLSDEEVSQR
jgi:hypothetical protein